VVQCIHGLAAPQLQAQLARMPAALQMGAKERAVYLGRKVLRGVKARRCSSVCTNALLGRASQRQPATAPVTAGYRRPSAMHRLLPALQRCG
jgi:hypothetical protein